MQHAGLVRRVLRFAGLVVAASAAILQGQTVSVSGGMIVIPSGTGNNKPAAYPTATNCTNAACVDVSGLSGTFISLTLELTFSAVNTQSLTGPAFLLQSPDGTHNLDFLSFTCGVSPTQPTPFDFTMTDSASSVIPRTAQCGTITNGTIYKPAAYAGTSDIFPSPGPASYTVAGDGTNGGSGTFTNTFGGIPVANLNGTWKLFVVDQANDANNTTISSWTLTITTTGSSIATTTTLNAGSPDPSFTSGTGSTVSFTAHVEKADNSGPATTGTVTIHDNTTTLDLNSQAVNSSGDVTVSGIITTEGTHDIIANFHDTSGAFADSSSNHVSQTAINHATGPTTNADGSKAFCNGPVTILSGNPATGVGGNPYPSEIILGGGEPTLGGIIQKLTLTLNNVQTQNLQQLGFLVEGPNANTFEFLAWAGGTTSTIGLGPNITLSDTGGAAIPKSSAPNCPFSSPCLPTDNANTVGGNDPFPSPAPALIDAAAPTGSATFAQEFGGLGVAGTWKLFLANRLTESGNLGSLGTWCLNFTMQSGAHPTMTTVSGSPNPVLTTGKVALTATVITTDGSGIVNAGTVAFVDGGTNLGSSVVANGTAMLMNVVLGEGTHHIVASYSGTNSGTVYGISSGHTDVRSNNPTTESSFQPYSYCNTGSISVPGNGADKGAAAPYPSNISVTNLPGTVKAVTVTLKSFSTNDQNDLLSLLVGPGGANLDFFSLTGNVCSGAACADTLGPLDVTFDDTAANTVTGDVTAGSFRPTSLNAAGQGVSPDAPVAYPACPPNALDCSSPPVGPPLPSNPFTPTNKAAPAGTGIFGSANSAGVFGGTSASTTLGNGTWSLYLDDAPHGAGRFSTIANGWCVNFTENPVMVAATKSHLGSNPSNHFVQGEQGAQFSVALQNNGVGSTGDPSTTNPMKVVDVLDSRFTYSIFSGADWSCSAVTQTVTCKNSDTIAQGSSYPTLTIFVNVSNTATIGMVTNMVSVSGGGASSTTASDTVTIDPAPVLSVTKTPVGTFEVGATAEWDITVNNTIANSTTEGTTTVTDTLQSGYTISSITISSAWNCGSSVGTGTLSCTSTQNVAGGSSFDVIKMFVNVPTNSPNPVSNTAGAFGGGDLTHTNSATAAMGSNTAPVVSPDLTVSKTHSPSTFQVNDASDQITITVANGGTAASSGTITVTDVLPAGLTFVNSTTAGWSCSSGTPNAQTVKCTTTGVLSSPSGTSMVVLNVSVASSTSTPLTNNVSVACSCAEANTSNNSNTDSIPVTQTVGITLATSPTGLQVSGDGGTTFFTAPHTFQFTPGSMPTIATTSPQSGGTGIQFVWTGWSDTGAISHTITVPSSPTTYTASLKTQFQLTTQVSPSTSEGSILPATGTFYDSGAMVSVSATANTGYVFTGFSGGLSGTTTPQNITMSAPETVTADFQPGPTSLGASIGAKSGTLSARTWPITIGNNGPGVALNASITSFTLTQTSGTACTPVVKTTMPAVVTGNNIAPHGTAVDNVVIDFSSCTGTVFFKLTANLSANSGAATGTLVRLNQLP